MSGILKAAQHHPVDSIPLGVNFHTLMRLDDCKMADVAMLRPNSAGRARTNSLLQVLGALVMHGHAPITHAQRDHTWTSSPCVTMNDGLHVRQ